MEYAVLGFLTVRAQKGTTEWPLNTIFWMAVLFCFLYGLSDEFHQIFVPGREASLGDAAADTIGGFLGSLFIIKGKHDTAKGL